MLDELPIFDLDTSLAGLLDSAYDDDERALAARYAPLIRLDDNEPFRPLVAGYTIFKSDRPSPSFERPIRIKSRRYHAARVIEYAIWWDWDINHLYELEHIWVYIDRGGRVVRVEGSWHGAFKNLAKGKRLQLNGERPIVYASPGKHAFAPAVEIFKSQQKKVPGVTTRFAGAAGISTNNLFAGKIWRTPIRDRLVHSYLARHAFSPSWRFSRTSDIEERILVPWPALREWIPARIHAWLVHLQKEIGPQQYRFLRMALCYNLAEIHQAGEMGLDMVQLGVSRGQLGLPVLSDESGQATKTNLMSTLRACARAQVGVYLVVHDKRIIPWLYRLLQRKEWTDYLMTGAENPEWVSTIKSKLPQYRTVLIKKHPDDDALAIAQSINANYIHITEPESGRLTPAWIQLAHQEDIGIVCGPAADPVSQAMLETSGIEAIVARDSDRS